jgi:hypothetical protein
MSEKILSNDELKMYEENILCEKKATEQLIKELNNEQ